jgi:hypothetical protein
MGRQIGFFTLKVDDDALLDIAGQHGMRALPAEIPSGSPVEPTSASHVPRPDGRWVFYLLPAAAPLDAVTFEEMSDRSRSMLMPDKSPVIQYVTCNRDGNCISNGRIYFDTQRSNPWFDHARRDFERLSRQIKRWPLTDRFRFHVGPAAARTVSAGQLHLRHAVHELYIAEG